jgi:hypothetical protein
MSSLNIYKISINNYIAFTGLIPTSITKILKKKAFISVFREVLIDDIDVG